MKNVFARFKKSGEKYILDHIGRVENVVGTFMLRKNLLTESGGISLMAANLTNYKQRLIIVFGLDN